MSFKIISPHDWTHVYTPTLDVILEVWDGQEIDLAVLECRLWSAKAFFEGQIAEALVSATFVSAGRGLARTRLTGLRAWGPCVLGVVKGGELPPIAGSGVMMGGEGVPRWLHAPPAAPGDLRFPLPLVDCELSFVAGQVPEPLLFVEDIDTLLDVPSAQVTAVRAVVLASSEILDATCALDRSACTSHAAERHMRMLEEGSYASDAPFVIDISDAHVILPSGVVLLNGDRIWSDSTHGAFWLDPYLTRSPGLFPAHGQIGLAPYPRRTMSDLLSDNAIETMPGIPLIAFGQASVNYMHWLTNSVFSAWLLREEIRAGRVHLLVPDLTPLTLASLATIGIGREALLAVPPGFYQFDRALYPSPLSTQSNRRPPRLMADMFRAIAESVAGGNRPTSPDLIYVTRQGAPSMRRMSNEAILVAALAERGFEVVAPHELAFADEVHAFSRAKFVIGQLGAGLCNVGFAPAGCRVLELDVQNYMANDIWYLSALMGHRFARITSHSLDNNDEFCSTPFSFEVPVSETLAMVDDLLRELR